MAASARVSIQHIFVPVHVCFFVRLFRFVFLAVGLVFERWEGIMKIVVCVYRFDFFFFLKRSFASNSYKGFD